MSLPKSLSVFAPAKINLYLHVTGKRDDGYHLLDSLVCFADIGDTITIEEDSVLSFHIEGPFARAFSKSDSDASKNSSNLVIRALWALADASNNTPDFRLILKKNMPLSSGLGGGSADAAAILWALMQWWNISPEPAYLSDIMADLGSDVAACYACKTLHMGGIGNELSPAPHLPELNVLLVHPGKASSTKDVYQSYARPFSEKTKIPEQFDSTDDFIAFLKSTSNDLTETAIHHLPDIQTVLDILSAQGKALITRMSGSGSTCFALFENDQDCMDAAENIIRDHPDWWVRCGTIGTPVRY
ncbi:MAG: 4-(cytidine 5'-diphospho)-2-C-methyl-D-erythritol kinase [Pseudomonadota bacterium]